MTIPNASTNRPDVVLVGAGIMSATLAVFLKELDPSLKIQLHEVLGSAAQESSNAWNNAGTGHAALCEFFKEMPAHSSFDWHNDPIPQYVITLTGVLKFSTVGGETFTIHPGDVLLADDHTGSGHKWRLINDEPWKRAYVVFKQGADTHFIPEPAGAAAGK